MWRALKVKESQETFSNNGNLSFIPFKDSKEANHTIAQKIQLTSEDLEKGFIKKDFKIPYAKLQDCEVFKGWREESLKGEIVKIVNKKGEFLFSIEKQNIKEDILDAKALYDYYGSQWFETSAEKYHKLLDVNPDLKDKDKCKELGVLYFTWREIVEFAKSSYQLSDNLFNLALNSFKYFGGGSGDWKAVKNGARGYFLVSMEGIPYWADAVGQIPYAINTYKGFLYLTHNEVRAKNATINIGYVFKKGKPEEIPKFLQYLNLNGHNFIDSSLYEENINPPIDKNSYDNKMILRAIGYAYFSECSNNQTLSLDSKGVKIYEK